MLAHEMEPAKLLQVVLSNPGFIAFCAIIGLRIRSGRAADAFAMLVRIGAPPNVAHGIIEQWPKDGLKVYRVGGLDITSDQAAACWLAQNMGDRIDIHNWAYMTRIAVEAARVAREE